MPENKNSLDDTVDKIFDAVDALVGPELTVEESNITYWYFSKENPTEGVPIDRESISAVANTSFKASRDTMFIVHGWRNSNTSSFITTVRQAVVANLDINIFVVDWSAIAAASYIPTRQTIPEVGNFLGDFIAELVTSYNLSLSQTTFVGHSLGGHVVGVAGAALNGSVAVIVGLDPALPLFLTSDLEDRLDPSDAGFVQVIHTNGGFKGYLSPIGHSDYYPNGGRRQPGCDEDDLGTCAHARAYEYYAESLGGGRFMGQSCQSYKEFVDGSCISRGSSPMGTYQIDKRLISITFSSSEYFFLGHNINN